MNSLALRSNGSVEGWGQNGYGQSEDQGNTTTSPIVERYSYDVYGKPTIKAPDGSTRTTSAFGNRFMFTGREYDSETGNYYYRARYYSPKIGRFLQTDPVGYSASGLNLYSYCGNNPLNWADPFGLCKRDIRNAWAGLQGFFAGLGQAAQFFKDQIITRLFIDPLGLISDTLHGLYNTVFHPLATLESIFSPMWNSDPYNIGRSIGNFTGNIEIGLAISAATSGLGGPGRGMGGLGDDAATVKVIGRLDDTAVAKGWPGHDVLDIADWTPKRNMQWVDEGILNKQPFYTASPEAGNLVQTSGAYAGEPTMYARELARLREAGYVRIGDTYYHPEALP